MESIFYEIESYTLFLKWVRLWYFFSFSFVKILNNGFSILFCFVLFLGIPEYPWMNSFGSCI